VHGMPQASVALRPVNLIKLEQLLRAGPVAQSQLVELAKELVFSESPQPKLH
jgi:hypothetical protein